MSKVFFASVAAYKTCAVEADRKLGDENQDLLAVITENFLAKREDIFQYLSGFR